MDNKEYLRRLFSDKKVIIALIILVITCVLSFFAAKFIPGKTGASLAQVACALLMFSQLLVVGKTANRIAAELEREAKKAQKKKKK